jgi:hypothetical protein
MGLFMYAFLHRQSTVIHFPLPLVTSYCLIRLGIRVGVRLSRIGAGVAFRGIGSGLLAGVPRLSIRRKRSATHT